MNRDPRVNELNNLRVALATFALRLDEFEARVKGRSTKSPTQKPRLSEPDIGFAKLVIAAMSNSPLQEG